MAHIMIDIETLDTRTSAVILAIGAVEFDPATNSIGRTLYIETSEPTVIDEQLARGRTVSGSTLHFWLSQSKDAKKLFAGSEGASTADLHDALIALSSFVDDGWTHDVQIWGNGSDFDNAILQHAYKQYGLLCPWRFHQNRCYRTLKNLGIGPRRSQQMGIPHNALHDAMSQANHLMEIVSCIKSRP